MIKMTMMRLVLTLFISLSLFSVISIGRAEAAGTWYVDSLGTDNSSSGSGMGVLAFRTIQYAINDSRVVNGDTINVASGTYEMTSTCNVTKSLSLIGPSSGDVAKLTGVNTSLIPNNSITSVFEISVSNVTIQNFEITHSALPAGKPSDWNEYKYALIRVSTTGGISILNNRIYVPAQSGSMTLWNGVGICVQSSSASDVTISNNTVYNTRNGILVRYGDVRATFDNNVIYNTKGGIMNYTGSVLQEGYRSMSNNSWTTVHNEWDIGWISGGGPYTPDYQQIVVLSNANNGAYVVHQQPTGNGAITGNRSHIFVNSATGTLTATTSSGNMNLPYKTIALGIAAVAPGGTIYVAAGTYAEKVIVTKPLILQGAGSSTTVVDASSLTAHPEHSVVSLKPTIGNVVFDGFVVQNGDNFNSVDYYMSTPSSVITISNNVFLPQGNPSEGNWDFGVKNSSDSVGKIILDSNEFRNNFYYDPIHFALFLGESEVIDNIIQAPVDTTAITYLTYDNKDVTLLQSIRGNIITHPSNSWANNAIYVNSAYQNSSSGRFMNLEILNNTINNVGATKRGIGLANDWNSGDGSAGDIVSPRIQGNIINGTGSSDNNRGLQLIGYITNADISGNRFINLQEGIRVWGGSYAPTKCSVGAQIHDNIFTDSLLYGVNMMGSSSLDAVDNWWGDSSGPTHLSNPSGIGDRVSDNVNFDPWLVEDPFSATVSLSSSPTSIVADGVSSTLITAAVRDYLGNLAPDGTDVIFSTSATRPEWTEDNLTKHTTGGVASWTLTSLICTDGIGESQVEIVDISAESLGAIAKSSVFFMPDPGMIDSSDVTGILDDEIYYPSSTPEIYSVTIEGIGERVLTLATFSENPVKNNIANSKIDAFYDVYVDDISGVDSVVISFVAREGQIFYYWDGSSWMPASNQTYSGGFVTITITDMTSPSLSDLNGLPFGSSPPPPSTTKTLAGIIPIIVIALFIIGAVGAFTAGKLDVATLIMLVIGAIIIIALSGTISEMISHW